jgi:hypothetical protein
MKKVIFGLFAVFAMTLALCSCGNSNTPAKVAEKSIEYIQDKNYEAYVDLIYIEEKEGEETKYQKEELVVLLRGKIDKTLEKKQGLASYKIVSEEISEDGKSAGVEAENVYGDGSTDKEKVNLVKNDAGEWMLSMNK